MKKKRNKATTIHFDISVNGECLPVKATAFQAGNKDETRFRVSYNGSPVIIFAWDNDVNQLVKSDPIHIPSLVEREIVNELRVRMAA